MQEIENNEEFMAVDPKIYEVGYLLVPTITEENVPVIYDKLKQLVLSFGGEIVSDEMPKMIPLAYTMLKVVQNVRSKWSNAYFGWIKFSMDPEKVGEFKKKLNLDSEIIRFLIIKTVKENTIASKRFVHREGGYSKKTLYTKKENVPLENTPINKEEVDKEIEAMVAD